MYSEIIAQCYKLIDQDIPIVENELEDALRALEKLRGQVLTARINAQSDLLRKTNQYLHPKDRDLTELDRKTMINFQTITEREYFELLAGYEGLLKDRHQTLSLLLESSL